MVISVHKNLYDMMHRRFDQVSHNHNIISLTKYLHVVRMLTLVTGEARVIKNNTSYASICHTNWLTKWKSYCRHLYISEILSSLITTNPLP